MSSDPAKGELMPVTPVPSDSALEALNRSEIDTQIATAKQYPRSVATFQREAMDMVRLSKEIADECVYSLKRSGKPIEGASARFAEIIASAWGNCRAGARIIGEDKKFVTAQGVFSDVERNVAISYETRRRITDRNGNTYKDDMIAVTANAACSIAMRNAVLKGIPKAFWKPIYDLAYKTAYGDAKTLGASRTAMLQHFADMKVTPDQVFALLEVEGEQDISGKQIVQLRGFANSIKEGEMSVDSVFGKQPDPKSRVKRSELNDKLTAPTGDPHPDEAADAAKSMEDHTPKPEVKPDLPPEVSSALTKYASDIHGAKSKGKVNGIHKELTEGMYGEEARERDNLNAAADLRDWKLQQLAGPK